MLAEWCKKGSEKAFIEDFSQLRMSFDRNAAGIHCDCSFKVCHRVGTACQKLLIYRQALPRDPLSLPLESEVTEIDQLDGLRMTLRDMRVVHLRMSGNAPELRIYVEADMPEQANEMLQFMVLRLDAAFGC